MCRVGARRKSIRWWRCGTSEVIGVAVEADLLVTPWIDNHKAHSRTRRSAPMIGKAIMETVFKDIRFSVRGLLKRPGFTAIIVITLALGIGANTAIFTVLNAMMLRALPVKDPQQLVFLSNPDRHGVNGGQETGNRFLFAYHEFEWLRDHNQVFSEIFAVQSALSSPPIVVEGSDQNEAERARITAV